MFLRNGPTRSRSRRGVTAAAGGPGPTARRRGGGSGVRARPGHGPWVAAAPAAATDRTVMAGAGAGCKGIQAKFLHWRNAMGGCAADQKTGGFGYGGGIRWRRSACC